MTSIQLFLSMWEPKLLGSALAEGLALCFVLALPFLAMYAIHRLYSTWRERRQRTAQDRARRAYVRDLLRQIESI